jgi:hypothetical protein
LQVKRVLKRNEFKQKIHLMLRESGFLKSLPKLVKDLLAREILV